MTTSPLSINRFRWMFIACMGMLAIVQAQVLLWMGMNFRFSIIYSVVSISVLAMACVAVSTGLRYYFPQQNRILYFILWCLSLAGLWLLATRWLMSFFLNDPSQLDFLHKSLPLTFSMAFLIIGWMAMITVLWYQQQQQKEDEQRKADAEKLNRDAELFRLRQQLQPHFLFNSLNSISALITSRPEEAKNMVQQLAEFLRGTLKKEDQWVNLEEEIHQLQLYLEIEKVRFGHRLLTEIICDEPCSKMKLPALLLQPIVENAIKFGLYDTIGVVTIRIRASFKDDQLIISVQNPFDSETSGSNTGTGFGLSSVQRRLYLLFGRNDLLQTSAAENIFTTTVQIPQQA